jgi:hypothetical protein
LGVLTAYGPRLAAAGMRAAGSTAEADIARAAAVVAEMIGYAAVSCHQDFNRAGVDYQAALPAPVLPDLREEGRPVFAALIGDHDWSEDWASDLLASFAGAKL